MSSTCLKHQSAWQCKCSRRLFIFKILANLRPHSFVQDAFRHILSRSCPSTAAQGHPAEPRLFTFVIPCGSRHGCSHVLAATTPCRKLIVSIDKISWDRLTLLVKHLLCVAAAQPAVWTSHIIFAHSKCAVLCAHFIFSSLSLSSPSPPPLLLLLLSWSSLLLLYTTHYEAAHCLLKHPRCMLNANSDGWARSERWWCTSHSTTYSKCCTMFCKSLHSPFFYTTFWYSYKFIVVQHDLRCCGTVWRQSARYVVLHPVLYLRSVCQVTSPGKAAYCSGSRWFNFKSILIRSRVIFLAGGMQSPSLELNILSAWSNPRLLSYVTCLKYHFEIIKLI